MITNLFNPTSHKVSQQEAGEKCGLKIYFRVFRAFSWPKTRTVTYMRTAAGAGV